MGEIQHAILRAHQHQTAQGQGRRGVIPAPVGGWNTQDPEASMDPSFGTQMENYFPERGRVISRRGSKEFADTTDTGAVETLFNWVSGAANKLFAITGTTLYDVTDPANVSPVTGVGSVTEGRWRSATMNGQGILVNGTDEPLRIDGTGAWVAHGFTATGLATTNLTQVAVFKNRLFFLEKDSASLWYGDLNAITGPLHKFNLGLVNEEGGNCLALGSLTLDTGVGVDDLLAICMSRGDVLIYAGTDPSTANAWQISGKVQARAVIGDRPLVKLGGDLIAITSDGYIPLLQFIGAGREQRQLAISDKIAPTVTQAVSTFGSVAGWQAILFSEANWLSVQRAGRRRRKPVCSAHDERPDGRMVFVPGNECPLLGDVQGEDILRLRCREGHAGRYRRRGRRHVDSRPRALGLQLPPKPLRQAISLTQGAYRERRCRFSGANRGKRGLRPQPADFGSRNHHAGRHAVGYSRLGHIRVGLGAG